MPLGNYLRHQKLFYLPILLLFAAFATSSCVTKAKYETAQQKIDRLKTENRQLAKSNARIRTLRHFATVDINEALEADYEQCTTKLMEMATDLEAAQAKIDTYEYAVDILADSLREHFRYFLPEEIDVVYEEGQLKVRYDDLLFFKTGRAKLSANAKQTLAVLADVLKYQEGDFYVNVIGHADPRKIKGKRTEDNWTLSMKRSLAVVRELEKMGVDPEYMSASARSYHDPQIDGDGKVHHAINRRAEIILVPQMENPLIPLLFTEN